MLVLEYLLHPLVRKLFLHLKEAILLYYICMKLGNQCWTCQFLVASEVQAIKLRAIRLGPCENM